MTKMSAPFSIDVITYQGGGVYHPTPLKMSTVFRQYINCKKNVSMLSKTLLIKKKSLLALLVRVRVLMKPFQKEEKDFSFLSRKLLRVGGGGQSLGYIKKLSFFLRLIP